MIQKRKWKSLLLAGVMTATMCLGMTAMAADVPTVGTGGSEGADAAASVTKVLEMAEGISIPGATFQFEITKVTADAPQAEIDDIVYTGTEDKGELTEGKYQISKDSVIEFGAFPHAGEYVYRVKETADTYTLSEEEGMVYSTEEYELHVYVVNGEEGVYVDSITAKDSEGEKTDAISFVNTYTKRGGSDDDAQSLIISKETVGRYADKTKDFHFTLTFTKAATATDLSYTGKIGEEEIVCEIGTAKEFTLHDGETLVFDNLPAGTRYVVNEIGTPGYTPSAIVAENGEAAEINGQKGQSLASSSTTNLVGEKANSAAYTNTYDDGDTPVTGIITNILPFVLLIAAAVAVFAVWNVLSRKKMR